jgi:RNA polymerase-binding transcription factor DksA
MSSLDVGAFRTRLQDQRRRIVREIEYLHHENPGSLEDESEERMLDNHLAETASITLDREVDYSLEESANRQLRAIDAALQRVEDGTYGTCTRCGKPIGVERLEALAWVPVIRLVGDVAKMLGYPVGVWWRMRQRGRIQ